MSSELPLREQLAKRGFVSEDVDLRGLVKRHRVVDQTVFDAMFLLEMIDQSHHEAAHLFLGDLIDSGALAGGCDYSGSSTPPPAHAVAGSMADRRMAFSAPFRLMVEKSSEDEADRFVRMFDDMYNYPKMKSELSGLAESVTPCLSALVEHYGVRNRRDPRRIVRRQLGHTK